MSGSGKTWAWVIAIAAFCGVSAAAEAAIHHAPVIILGSKIRAASRYPINTYRLFRTGNNGMAEPIPFQIDEINEWGDYVLDQGGDITKNTGNGIFDLQDELVFMGDDVGPSTPPTAWPDGQVPAIVYELRMKFQKPDGAKPQVFQQEGAVYIAVYFRKPPKPSTKAPYVVFDTARGEVVTTRYRYEFDKKNYLVVNGVDMLRRPMPGSPPSSTPVDRVPLINTSTFYMKADLKYFVTVAANHRSVDSKIEAFKQGPVRSIVRVSFFYSFLKLKFELGMYTEVSFFPNSVVLPAILYNPLDGPNALNKGSDFCYGFSVKEHLDSYNIATNMETFEKQSIFSMLKSQPKKESLYWLSITKPDRMMYLEVAPSPEMTKVGNIPLLYSEKTDGEFLKSRSNDDPKELGLSPVNIALYFDLTKFGKGEHRLAIKLFFENYFDQAVLESFRDVGFWEPEVRRM